MAGYYACGAFIIFILLTTTNELWGNRAMWFHVNMSQLPLLTQILSEKSFASFKSLPALSIGPLVP